MKRLLTLCYCLMLASLAVGQIDTIGFEIGCSDGLVGQSACVDVTTENFEEVLSIQGSVNFNSNIIRVTSVDVANTCITDFSSANFNLGSVNLGYISFLWYDINAVGQTCADNSVLFSICFEFIGDPGECSPFLINNAGIEFLVETPAGFPPTQVTTCENCNETNQSTIVSKYCEASPGGSDGSLTFYPIGGSAPYNFTVTRGAVPVASGSLAEQELWTQSPLPQGIYTITITGSNGMSTTKNVSITDNFPLDVTLSATDPTCFSAANGKVNFQGAISGGQAPYGIEWSTGIYNRDSIDALPIGNYSVLISDATGCEISRSISLNVDTFKAEVNVLAPFYCVGSTDASIEVKGLNGIPQAGGTYTAFVNNFRFPSVNAANGMVIPSNNLKPTFEVYVVDGSLPRCTSEVITVNIPVLNDMDLTVDNINNVRCKGDMNGMVRVTANIPGETNFSFEHRNASNNSIVSNGTGSSNFYFNNNLGPGSYFIAARSTVFGCRDTVRFDITEPAQDLVLVGSKTDPSCVGNDGRVTIAVTGGVPTYSYAWSPNVSSSNVANNLSGGPIKVVVTDNNTCKDSLEYLLPVGGNLTIDAKVLQTISCTGKTDGRLIVNVSPPGNYAIMWTNASGANIGSQNIVEGVGAGRYFVEVSAPGCAARDTVDMINPPGMRFDAVNITPPNCPKQRGSIGAVIDGGFAPYNYVWTREGSTIVIGIQSVLLNIPSGAYKVFVTDINGCSIDTTVTMNEPASINLAVTNVNPVICKGDSTGSASAMATGGSTTNPTFTYLWSNGRSGTTNMALPPGRGWVLAADSKCSSDTAYFDILDALPLQVTERVEAISCAELCNGKIVIEKLVGNPNIDVRWIAQNVTRDSLINLCEGRYEYSVTDSDGCTATGDVVLSAPDTLIASINNNFTRQISCRTNTGNIGVTVEGGNGGYMYKWTNNVSTQSVASGLTQGTYMVTVTDAKGCSSITSYTLTNPSEVTATIATPNPPLCFGGLTCIEVTSASGGVGTMYSVQINQGPKFPLDSCIEVFAGTHRVNVFDETGCTYETSITIGQPEEVTVDLGEDIEVILGNDIPLITAAISNNVGIDTIMWTTIDPFECNVNDNCTVIRLKPLVDQMVEVMVTDSRGCSAQDALFIKLSDIREVYFPNVFSPNGDAVNDYFFPAVGPGIVQIDELRVYDRWGNLFFEKKKFVPNFEGTEGWNGKFQEEFVQPGVYIYQAWVTFVDGRKLQYTGDITVIR